MSIIADFLNKSARNNVEAAIARAKSKAEYNALISITEERALARADEIDSNDHKGKLAGVPFVVKDNYLAFGAPTTAASKILSNFEAPLQATVVENLESEGAICIGKANLDAFAHGSSTENSAFGVTKNAHDKTRVAGGSSGGSAVVTALDIVPFALGSDTGGSIRQPASFNGVVGVKPTYGMSSRYGVVAMANSTDCMGVFTTNSSDAELVLEIMSGQDKKDMTSLPDFFEIEKSPPVNQRVGVIRGSMTSDVDEEVQQVVNSYVDKLKAAGHSVDEIDMPISKYALAMYYIIVPAEVSSNLARYDGIRYGKREGGDKSLTELYSLSRSLGFETENKRRIMIGSYVLSSGYFDAYYLKAQKARTLLIQEFNNAFNDFDVLISPTTPDVAFGIGDNVSDPMKMYMADIMTVPASLAGLPAISVPAGKSSSGLPVGVQLVGQRKSDAVLMALAKSLEDK